MTSHIRLGQRVYTQHSQTLCRRKSSLSDPVCDVAILCSPHSGTPCLLKHFLSVLTVVRSSYMIEHLLLASDDPNLIRISFHSSELPPILLPRIA